MERVSTLDIAITRDSVSRHFSLSDTASHTQLLVTESLDKYSVGYHDTDLGAWIAEEGSFKVLIGASSADIR